MCYEGPPRATDQAFLLKPPNRGPQKHPPPDESDVVKNVYTGPNGFVFWNTKHTSAVVGKDTLYVAC